MAVYTVRRFKSSISSFSQSMAQMKDCYYTEWRVWLKLSSVSHMKHDRKFTNERVLITIIEVVECGECRTVYHSQCMVFFVWLFSQTLITTSFKYAKRIFTLNRLVQVMWLLHAIQESYSLFLLGFSMWTYYSAWLMEFQATLCFWHHVGERDSACQLNLDAV